MNKFGNILKQADIFDQFTQSQIDLVAVICKEKSYADGEIIVREGANSDDLYVIADGEVAARVLGSLADLIQALARPFELFVYRRLLLPVPRPAADLRKVELVAILDYDIRLDCLGELDKRLVCIRDDIREVVAVRAEQ